jgi:hypothetical protein
MAKMCAGVEKNEKYLDFGLWQNNNNNKNNNNRKTKF